MADLLAWTKKSPKISYRHWQNWDSWASAEDTYSTHRWRRAIWIEHPISGASGSLTEDAAPQKFLAEKIAPYFADISFDAPILVTAFDDDGAAFTATMKEYYSEITVANGESPSLQNCSLVVVGKTYNQDGQGVADNGYLAVLGEFADIDSEGAAMNRLHRSFRREECPLPPSREVREFLKNRGSFPR